MNKKQTTGMILRELRGTKTQEEIASDLGITKSSWAMYERDERVPRDEIKVRIAKYFGKSVQELFYAPIEHYKCS
jgi:DNA-binding XRE family transcriptional regulator